MSRQQEKITFVIGIYGAGKGYVGGNPALQKLVLEQEGKMFYHFTPKSILLRTLHSAFKQHQQLKIYGYSRGGNVAVAICNQLEKKNIPIAELVLFDAHSIWDNHIFQLKSQNVKRVRNYYQRNPRTAGKYGWWGSNPYWGCPIKVSPSSALQEENLTGKSLKNFPHITHLNIISAVVENGGESL